MKAIVNTAPGQLEWQELPTPQPGLGQVRIRTAACGICATDLEMIKGWQRTGFPAIPGHEWSGVVDAVGAGGDASLVGKPCVASNVWSDGGEVGFEHPGGYGQYFLTEANLLHELPADFPLWQAALIEPLTVCVRAMRRLHVENRRSAVVFGDGAIGLLTLALLKHAGVEQVALVGGRPARLAVAAEFGADNVINYHQAGGSLVEMLSATPGTPYPNVVEASGSATAVAAAMKIASRGAKVLIVGDYGKARADFAWNDLLHRELRLIGSNASAGAWAEAVALATSSQIPLARLVSRRLPASQFAAAMDLVQHDRDIVKVILDWQEPPT